MSPAHPRRIAVVGGGVSGLALAAALPRTAEVVLHEAQPERAGAGWTLVLGPWVRPALHRLGVLDAVVRAGTPVGPGRLLALDGRPLTPAHDAHLLAVPRPALLAALGGALGPSVRVVHDEVLDPAALDGDLVVGADGVRSRVRALVDPAGAERLVTPWVALRGRLGTTPAREDVGEYWGPGMLAGVVPSPGGGYWFTTHRSALGPEPLDVPEVLAEARRAATGAAPVVRALLDDASGATATRLWVAPPLRRYVRDRYVVLGDAAHAMTPNLGRGAGEGLLDAVTLADHLAGHRSLVTWQVRRLPRTRVARAASSAVMRLALLGPGHALRDRALRLSLGAAGPRAGRR
ncbi:FAD-dependent monooxygenase [Phycicoccus avicenniae]|uniref:FAD-dependent monooxygenase n=1 Tax=Phycicoccus avicenniae TaxID=2828860 RepID=UPI003D2DEF45